jgi:predicted RNA-binding protein (virulence factor B family)
MMKDRVDTKISHEIKVGKINSFAVTRIIEFGLVLRNHNGDEEVLLPNAYVTEEMKELGQVIEVFVYTDSEDRRVATTLRPLAMEGELGYFEVVDFKSYGAFVDWGLPKDLFVPLSQQKTYFQIGKKYILRVALDEETGRLYGSQKIGRWLEDSVGLTPSQKVEALVIAQTPLGYKIVIENRFEAMLYSNEIFEPLEVGDRKTVYIKAIRSDGKVDCSLQPLGKQAKISAGEKKVLEILQERGGSVAITTKSSAEEIEAVFGMSKKMFKATVNPMLVDGRLRVEEGVVSSEQLATSSE